MSNLVYLVNYLDVPSFIWLLVLQIVLLALAGQLNNFLRAIKIVFTSKKHTAEELQVNAKSYEYAIDFAIKVSIIAGAAIALFEIIDVLQNIWPVEIDLLAYNIAVRLLAPFYSLIAALILLPITGRIHKMRKQ